MTRPTILIVEDEPDIRELLEYTFGREGYEVSVAGDGLVGLSETRRQVPDLLLLDLMLPGLDGLEVCRRLKQDPCTRAVPIVMVTAKGDEADVVLGLGLGADDYVAKPFSAREVVARVAAVLRRVRSTDDEDRIRTVVQGELRIDPTRHRVSWGARTIELTVTEFRILHYLALSPGRVFSREQILVHALGPNVEVTDRSVDVHVRSIRKKLGAQRDLVETVRGIGYRFAEEH
jgi:two-component system phosphate regulon response regulator PhoB